MTLFYLIGSVFSPWTEESRRLDYNIHMTDQPSPKITHHSWGKLEVEGAAQPFKDAKLYPGGSRAWDWRETGTEHSPGVQPADVDEIIEHGAKVIVLSTGVFGRLGVAPETLADLHARGLNVHVLKTKQAIQLYNQLREKEPAGALIHSTC